MGTSDSTTQPIVCCIGQSVAGQPTQFLLERAFESIRLHWRALSVEIRPEKLSLVCEAAREMGFHGLRFFESLEVQACELLTQPTSIERFVGRVTSAMHDRNGWKGWDNRGPAWMNLIRAHSIESIWLHGDSPSTRSLFVQLLKEPSLNWIWTEAPPDAAHLEGNSVRNDGDANRLFLDCDPPSSAMLVELGVMGNPSMSVETAAKTSIAFVTEQTQIPQDYLTSLGASLGASNQALNILTASLNKSTSGTSNVHWIAVGHADLAVAAELYDFQQWTDKAIDSSILRDAYDEYCDF